MTRCIIDLLFAGCSPYGRILYLRCCLLNCMLMCGFVVVVVVCFCCCFGGLLFVMSYVRKVIG